MTNSHEKLEKIRNTIWKSKICFDVPQLITYSSNINKTVHNKKEMQHIKKSLENPLMFKIYFFPKRSNLA